MYRGHQRKRQERGLEERQAVLRARLRVGGDARRIVVGRSGNQAWTDRLQVLTKVDSCFRRARLVVARDRNVLG